MPQSHGDKRKSWILSQVLDLHELSREVVFSGNLRSSCCKLAWMKSRRLDTDDFPVDNVSRTLLRMSAYRTPDLESLVIRKSFVQLFSTLEREDEVERDEIFAAVAPSTVRDDVY
ncbi:hypothetical protein CDAR_101471 [Caerostris darwini]|uniref:Uncharacterized protein n=1 Tax=Caerostris darwini TaxID=1538125 RepID=A0AAV4W511_9ARAC|nr:hypothetical protein CDAR_101471 [Caerostris darwini]